MQEMINYFHLSHFIFIFIEYIKSFLEVLMNNYRNNKYHCRFPVETETNCNCMPAPCPIMPREQCGCDTNMYSNNGCDNMPLAMAYVPWQTWNKTYELDKALHVGTLFPCLDKPFMGRCACK
jgi:hypothetical protein